MSPDDHTMTRPRNRDVSSGTPPLTERQPQRPSAEQIDALWQDLLAEIRRILQSSQGEQPERG